MKKLSKMNYGDWCKIGMGICGVGAVSFLTAWAITEAEISRVEDDLEKLKQNKTEIVHDEFEDLKKNETEVVHDDRLSPLQKMGQHARCEY